MKKEVLIAVVSGLILGLIVTLGIFTANRALNQQKAKKAGQLQSPLPTPGLNQQAKKLDITSPQPFDLIEESEVTLAGIAWPDAVVSLLAETQTFLTQADNEGIFTFKFNLIKGFNELTVLATDESGQIETQNLVLTYSTTKIEL